MNTTNFAGFAGVYLIIRQKAVLKYRSGSGTVGRAPLRGDMEQKYGFEQCCVNIQGKINISCLYFTQIKL